jgi:23S rRNA pseudouridine2605 synthase
LLPLHPHIFYAIKIVSMMKDNKRNSRDDKSKAGGNSAGRRTTGADRPKSKYGSKDEKGSFGGKDFKPRASQDNESRPYTSKSNSDKGFKPRADKDGPSRPYQSKPGSEKTYKPRTDRDGQSKPYQSKSDSDRPYKPRTEGNEKGGFKPWEKKESGNSGYKGKAFKEGSSNPEFGESKRSYIKKDKYSADGTASGFASKGGTARSTDSRPYRKRDEKDFNRQDRGERVAPTTRARTEPVKRLSPKTMA